MLLRPTESLIVFTTVGRNNDAVGSYAAFAWCPVEAVAVCVGLAVGLVTDAALFGTENDSNSSEYSISSGSVLTMLVTSLVVVSVALTFDLVEIGLKEGL